MKCNKKFHILTFGCQMNTYDSNLMAYLLEKEGFQRSDRPERADLIVVNTCAVREHAVSRALSRIAALAKYKERNPKLRIGVTGCIPQQLRDALLEKHPFIDFLLGPDNLTMITECAKEKRGAFIELDAASPYSAMTPARGTYPEAFVAAMRGCNNFCSYCVVPYLRGRERSRKLEQILNEITQLSRSGYRRVILLGQNVNNYRDCNRELPELLSAVSRIDGIHRIGFLTSHPAYFPLAAIDRMRDDPKIEKFLHLPLQSGSTRMLSLMKRQYTRDEYLALISQIRKRIPDIALSTDIIAGFPGETDEDFLLTIDTMKAVEFDFAYMFRYSSRRNTLANSFRDDLSEHVKKARLRELIRVQSSITREKSRAFLGKILDVLALQRNKKNLLETDAISVYNKRIIVKSILEPGTVVRAKIIDVKGWTPIAVPE